MISYPKTARRRSFCRAAGIAVAGLLTPTLVCACHSTHSGAGVAHSAVSGTGDAAASESISSGAYVALGDSFTSAPLVANQNAQPAGCLRSDADYPSLVAKALHPRSFTDVSCYGASSYDMTHPERTIFQQNPPQFNALSADDSLVTVQVGGDDVGFQRILFTCGGLSVTDPFGSPCMDHYTDGGTDQLAQAIARTAPKITAVLRGIHERAPHARIMLIGYPDLLPTQGSGCWPWVPIARGDVPYLRTVETRLNAMLATAAATAGASYVDTYAGTIGHDACEPSGVKWVEGLIPTSLAAPMHPNAAGEQAMARLILTALR